jgi:hypothetical protein
MATNLRASENCSSVVVRRWPLKHGDSSGTQSKGNVCRLKPLPGNG